MAPFIPLTRPSIFPPTLQLLGDVRAILKNFQQWPTAAQADSQYQTFIREQVGLIQRHGRDLC